MTNICSAKLTDMTAAILSKVTQLAAADPATCDRVGLAALAATSQQVRSWLDALDATIARCADQLAAAGTCEPAAALLNLGGRRSSRDAEAASRRGEVCELLPGVHEAWATGTISAGHADALARVAATLDERGRDELRDLSET
jgi:hypothetical protein